MYTPMASGAVASRLYEINLDCPVMNRHDAAPGGTRRRTPRQFVTVRLHSFLIIVPFGTHSCDCCRMRCRTTQRETLPSSTLLAALVCRAWKPLGDWDRCNDQLDIGDALDTSKLFGGEHCYWMLEFCSWSVRWTRGLLCGSVYHMQRQLVCWPLFASGDDLDLFEACGRNTWRALL